MKIRIRSDAYSYIALMAIMVVFLGLALAMEHSSAKMIPLIIGSLSFGIAAIGLARVLWGKTKPETIDETGGEEEATESWRQYLAVGALGVGFYLVIYLLGFFIAIALFIPSTMKFRGTSWLVTIIFTIITPAIIYGLFELALRVELYRGLLFT